MSITQFYQELCTLLSQEISEAAKTTLTRMLAEHYGWIPRYESVDYNPYLVDFYNDMERWSFNIQIYFLNKRFLDVVEISKSDDVIVQDRSIYEDACIFAPNLHAMGLMATRDYENYASLFSLMVFACQSSRSIDLSPFKHSQSW